MESNAFAPSSPVITDSVAVLAVDINSKVLLTWRTDIGMGAWSLPCGDVAEADGSAAAAAQRELAATGIRAVHWTPLRVVDDMAIRTHLFLATDLSTGHPPEHFARRLSVEWVPMISAIDLALNGQISHGPSALALLDAGLRLHRLGR